MVIMRRLLLCALLVVFIAGNLSGCALVKLKEDVKFSQDSCLLFGEVISPSASKKPVVVVAYSRQGNSINIADYAVLSEPGGYEMLVPHGKYEIFAFEDPKGTMSPAGREWAGYYGKPDQISTGTQGVIYGLDVLLSRDAKNPDAALNKMLTDFSGRTKKPPTSAGAIADLDNPAFSAEQGSNGFWAPLEFFKKYGANVYFLEPYDRKKTPVLFVHGAAGSPQDWRYFVNNIDRSRYQPWIFYYPSGARLATVSFLLSKKLHDLYGKYHFDHMFIVAHSMGGLVSRGTIIEKSVFQDSLKLFVSISSPWGGEQRAKTGVRHSPAVIPSWKDVEPDSEFIKLIFATKFPSSLRYYLFFGHKGGGSLFRQNNDNTVTLESMLDMRAQAEALKVTGLNEDHVSILSSPEMMTQFKSVLSATEANIEKTYARSKGYLNVQHSFAPAETKIPLQMALVLAPAGTDEQDTQLKIDPFKPLQETSGIAPKKYDVSLCALGFKTEPSKIMVDVQAGKISDVRYVLKPQGMVAGIIYASAAEGDSFWGFYRELPDKVKIRTIALTGNGLKRTMTPLDKMREREVLDTFLSSKDFAFKNQFAFFDVPVGEYTLSVTADGCEPYAAKVKVQPGEFVPPPPFVLKIK